MIRIKEQIDELHSKAVKTGWSRMGGYLPHTPRELTDQEISYGLQRSCGWKLTPEAIRALKGE